MPAIMLVRVTNNRYPKMSNLEVAIIDNGQVIQVIPKNEYDQMILQSRSQKPVIDDEIIRPLHIDQAQQANTSAVTIQPNVGGMMTEKTKPFKEFGISVVMSVFLVIIGAMLYKAITGKMIKAHTASAILAIIIAVNFLRFLSKL